MLAKDRRMLVEVGYFRGAPLAAACGQWAVEKGGVAVVRCLLR